MAPRRVGSLSPPPARLRDQELPILPYRATLFRVHWKDQNAAFWGKTGNNRFDAPAGEFGVLYAATDEYGAFIETYGDTSDRTITSSSLMLRGWARVEPIRELRLVDLSGPGLAQIGADERLCSGEHHVAQRWSLALWQHPSSVDGLYYRARHDPSRLSVALFERAAGGVLVVEDGGLLDERHEPLLAGILEIYRFSLL